MNRPLLPALFGFASLCGGFGASFDAAPFALPLPEGNGLMWEDPRELHQVIVQFEGAAPPPEQLRLEYWGSRWPQQRLPKDHEPGGGDVGWMELGNWYNGGWRAADAEAKTDGSQVVFSFRPLNAKEYPNLNDYPASFRYTLKLRVRSSMPAAPGKPGAAPAPNALPRISRIQAFTDSAYERRLLRLAWEKSPEPLQVEAFNGVIEGVERAAPLDYRIAIQAVANPDPNSFDRTLVTVRNRKDVFRVGADDLNKGALFLPHFGVAVLPAADPRDYAASLL